eukprot:PhF_6_TR38706/c0_g2_i1/m.57921
MSFRSKPTASSGIIHYRAATATDGAYQTIHIDGTTISGKNLAELMRPKLYVSTNVRIKLQYATGGASGAVIGEHDAVPSYSYIAYALERNSVGGGDGTAGGG